mmetsp:Transcript_11374/g.22663  ORF Transcript_11374/g.22663 Transcript_11374/m.22663 type:complete len:303 (+) Transcript_11374:42-950(+)
MRLTLLLLGVATKQSWAFRHVRPSIQSSSTISSGRFSDHAPPSPSSSSLPIIVHPPSTLYASHPDPPLHSEVLPTTSSSSSSSSSSSILPRWRQRLRAYFETPSPLTCQTPLRNLQTLFRITVPSAVAAVVAFVSFPWLALNIASAVNNAGVFAVLSQDSSQFVQNFLTVTGLLFSILVGQTYYFMYQQQEAVYLAVFNEVTEAKSLLEQSTLVAGARPVYPKILKYIDAYVQDDLKQLSTPPARTLGFRPDSDPLESIMYLTSVGVTSGMYETVRTLRQARSGRLGAMQRKVRGGGSGRDG